VHVTVASPLPIAVAVIRAISATPAQTDASVVAVHDCFCVKEHYRKGGIHKAIAVESEFYLLKCYRYIELNPVNTNMVAPPEEYRWTNYHINTWEDGPPVTTPHHEYLSVNTNSESRHVN
jgi:hypothetical protein